MLSVSSANQWWEEFTCDGRGRMRVEQGGDRNVTMRVGTGSPTIGVSARPVWNDTGQRRKPRWREHDALQQQAGDLVGDGGVGVLLLRASVI